MDTKTIHTFNLAFLDSGQKFYLSTFPIEDEEIQRAEYSSNELSQKNIQVLFVGDELSENDVVALLSTEYEYYPIRRASEFNLKLDDFKKLNQADAKDYYYNLQGQWSLLQSIKFLESLFDHLDKLSGLWKNHRCAFFEELFNILRPCLGTRALSFIYNDIALSDKKELTLMKTHGTRLPKTQEALDAELALMSEFEGRFQEGIHITEYNSKNGLIAAMGKIKKSPFILMGQGAQLTKIQQALLKSFFDGLCHID